MHPNPRQRRRITEQRLGDQHVEASGVLLNAPMPPILDIEAIQEVTNVSKPKKKRLGSKQRLAAAKKRLGESFVDRRSNLHSFTMVSYI